MFKKLVNILLIVVLMVTVLPLKQVGRMLFNNQWTEELNEHSDHSPEKKSQPAKWTFLGSTTAAGPNGGLLMPAVQPGIHFSQTLPFSPTGEIHSPPPNFIQ